MSRAHKLLAVIIVAAVIAAIYAAALRWRVEMPNRSAALILDWQEVQALAAAEGVPLPDALQRLRTAGATTVAVSEQHLSDLIAAGQVTVLPMAAAGFDEEPPGGGVVLSAWDAATAQRLRDELSAKLPPGALSPPPGAEVPPLLVPCRASPAYLETMGLGWADEAPSLIREAGMGVAVRLVNYPGAQKSAITFAAAESAAAGANLVIFSGDQVLGYPGLIQETAKTLRAAGLTYGSVELAEQLGNRRLGRALEGELVRVHSITETEILGMAPETAVERYVRAVRERGIRACYVRLFLAPRERLLEFNERYIGALKHRLAAAGYDTGSPRPLAPVAVPMWALIVMAAGAVAAAVFALGSVVPLAEWLVYLLFLAGGGMGAGLLVVAPHLARAEKALLAAVVFPSIGLIAIAQGARSARGTAQVTPAGLAARCAGWLIGASIISGAGGLVVSGLLTERLYMAQVLQFMGVKLSLGAPLLVVAAVWILGLQPQVRRQETDDRRQGTENLPSITCHLSTASSGWAAYRRQVQDNFRRAWNRPLYMWEVVLAAALLAAAAVMVMRSGNQPGVEVSGLELRARGILEQIFFARPRTKEFLVGHPAMMLAVALALRGRTRWVLLLLLLGAVGQASLVNTFCHLHTPVFISLLRSAHGLWLGLAIGAIAVWLWDRLRGGQRVEPVEEQTSAS
jgi:hypothetical protein